MVSMKKFPFSKALQDAGASKEAQRRELGGPHGAADLAGAGFDVFFANGGVNHCV